MAVLTSAYMNSAIIHPELYDQCILGKFGTFRNSYRVALLSYSSIGRPSFKIWNRVVNWTFFFSLSNLFDWFSCCNTVSGALALNNTCHILLVLRVFSHIPLTFFYIIGRHVSGCLTPTLVLLQGIPLGLHQSIRLLHGRAHCALHHVKSTIVC
jgi:hypothetical protein